MSSQIAISSYPQSRSLLEPYRGKMRTALLRNLRELLKHHQKYHHKLCLKPIIHEFEPNIFTAGYEFYGRFVKVATSNSRSAKELDEVKPMRISEVALLVLEQTFGKADDLNGMFLAATFLAPGKAGEKIEKSRRSGRVFWDVTNDRIIVKTKRGFILALQGTNIVEAAVYLPRIYADIRLRLFQRLIPEGVDTVVVRIEQGEELSRAASPLEVECRLPNLGGFGPSQSIDDTEKILTAAVRGTLKRALNRRIKKSPF